MTNKELIALVGATLGKKTGRTQRVRTTNKLTKRFVAKRQALLRGSFRRPDEAVDVRALIDNRADVNELFELGFTHFTDLNTDDLTWTHRYGDDHGIKVLIGLIDGRAEHTTAAERGEQMRHAVQTGRARLAR